MILLALLLAAAPPSPDTAPRAADPRSEAARYAACVRQSDSDTAAAIKAAKDWAAAGGGIAAAHCLGIAESTAGDWPAAADAFTAGATIAGTLNDDRAATLWVSAGDAALAGGDAARARTAFGSALALPSLIGAMRGEALVDRARAAVAGADLAAARGDLDAALALVPADPVAWLLSATLARRMGDGTRAAADIREAETRAPGDPAIALEAGTIAATAGDMATARADWTHARQADPDGDVGQAAINRLAADAVRSSAPAAPARR